MAVLQQLAGVVDGLRDRLGRSLFAPTMLRRARTSRLAQPIARRQARALFDLVSGFVYSQILLACVRLRVFELLAPGALRAEELAPQLDLDVPMTEQLLDGAVVIGLLKRRASGRYALSTLGAAVNASAGIRSMVEHNALLYRDMQDPVALLRGEGERHTALSAFWPYAAGMDPGADAEAVMTPEVAERYSALMAASQDLIADEVLDGYSMAPHRQLLDVGGGNGTFIGHAAERWPHLRFQLVDLAPVAAVARQRLADTPLAQRVEVCPRNFLLEPLPDGADVVTLVRVLHDQDDAGAMAVLRAIHRMLPPDGVLLLAEPMRGTPSAPRVGDAYFAFYLLAMGRGRPRSATEITSMLQEAGFSRVRRATTHVPLQTSLLMAQP